MDSHVSNHVIYSIGVLCRSRIRRLDSVARKSYIRIIVSAFGSLECLYRQFSKEYSVIKYYCDYEHLADYAIFLETAYAETGWQKQ